MPNQQPPSDAVMCKVIAKQFNEQVNFLVFSGDEFQVFPEPGVAGEVYADPRTDTDAALELLCWICFNGEGSFAATAVIAFFSEWLNGEYTSGQPLRTAACNLAAKVLGVDEGGDSE